MEVDGEQNRNNEKHYNTERRWVDVIDKENKKMIPGPLTFVLLENGFSGGVIQFQV